LWNEAFIDPKGDVYACCRKKPSVIGNIYEQKLEDIYNNGKIRELRQKSLDGRLECYADCTIIDKEKEQKHKPPQTTTIDYKNLQWLKIEFGELCNINCVMCWQDHKSRTVLSFEKLVENVDLTPFKYVEIQGGEPLAIPAAKNYFEYVAAQRKRPFFLTNGLLINDDWAQKIVSHSSSIHISLNAATKKTHEMVNQGSKWETVLKNIQRLQDAKKQKKAVFKIIGHMTIIIENLKEIPLFINNFKEFGVDKIQFGFDHKVPGYLKNNPFLKIALKKEIVQAHRKSRNSSSVELKRLKMLELI
jgi:radical SAM protein with 4Fe4S-binding SPASM domain